jgi:predicted amidohydrolase YtcJ
VHCIGDKANRTLLDIFEATLNATCGENRLRHRIEHAQHLTEVDVKRFGKLGIVASVQPIHIALDMDTMKRRLRRRGRWAYPFRSLLDNGAVLAFGSDAPVERLNPFFGIYTAVTRKRGSNDEECWYTEECISVEEAARAYTIGGAFAACEENQRGTISQHKLADMIVISKNIFEISVEQIKEVEVEITVFNGEIVYKRATQQE